MVLLKSCELTSFEAAKEVSRSYDTIVDLLGSLNDTLERLKVHLQHTITAPLRKIIVDALVQLLSILAMARNMISEGRLRRSMAVIDSDAALIILYRSVLKVDLRQE